MTAATRDNWSRLVVVVALALFAWTHRHAFEMSGFADDLGLLVELSQRERQGNLLADVLAHLTQPLWPGSTMWRPLAYASFAMDAAVWSGDAGLWRVTNLALHVMCAVVAGLICQDLTQRRRAGAVGFAVFLLIPWSPEVVVWLVGRFDGLATLGILFALWAALRSRGFDRWWVTSLAAGACAYASKESALILPAWVVLVALHAWYRERAGEISTNKAMKGALKDRASLLFAHGLLAAAYLLWRAALFPASSLKVYASGPQLGLPQLATQLWSHAQFPLGLVPLAPIAAWIVGACFVSVVAIAWRSPMRSGVAVGSFFLITVVAAVATYFAVSPGEGDGYRLYYLATLGFALIAASATTQASRVTPVVLTVLLAALAFWQARVTDEWRYASDEMNASAVALRRAANAMRREDYGLVLLPDQLGHVPFARNAQGALPKSAGLPAPTVDVLSHLVVFTPPQIDEWHRLAQESVVRKITARTDAPPNPTQYFCFDSRTQTLRALGYWVPSTLEQWRRNWRASVDTACPRVANH